jgi:hypothetical protein
LHKLGLAPTLVVFCEFDFMGELAEAELVKIRELQAVGQADLCIRGAKHPRTRKKLQVGGVKDVV